MVFSAKQILLNTVTEKTRAGKCSVSNPKCPENQQSTASPPCSGLGYCFELLLAQYFCPVPNLF